MAGLAKDGSPIANIDADRALISFKEMPIAAVEANHDAGEVARGQIGRLAVERATLINHFSSVETLRSSASSILTGLSVNRFVIAVINDPFFIYSPASSCMRRAS